MKNSKSGSERPRRTRPTGPSVNLLVSAQPMNSYLNQIRAQALAQAGYLNQIRSQALAQAASLLNIMEGLKAGTKADRELLAQLAPRGWLISPSAPDTISQTLLAQLKIEGIDAVETGP